MRKLGMASLATAALALMFAISGCGDTSITYVDNDNSYTRSSALELATDVPSDKLNETPTEKSQELRSEALSDLRNDGEAASQAATLITSTLPQDSKGVPFYVERASYEGTESILIVEAIGRAGGTLSDKRLWVLSLQGDVLLSGNR